jgi:hypothetical protein
MDGLRAPRYYHIGVNRIVFRFLDERRTAGYTTSDRKLFRTDEIILFTTRNPNADFG